MTSPAVSSTAATGRIRREESAAFARRLRLAAGAALGLHLLLTFAIPHSQLPISDLESHEPEGTQVELVGSPPETAPTPPEPEPLSPPPAPAPKPEPPPPPPKLDPETIALPDPPPKPVAQPPPPAQPPQPLKPKPQPVAEKKHAPSPNATPRAASAAASGTPGAASGAVGTPDGKSTRPGYLEKPAPKYPPESEAAREHGTVILSVEINTAGRPESVKLEKSSGYPRLDRAAIEAVRRWRFKPATRDGQPVAARVNIPVLFKLP